MDREQVDVLLTGAKYTAHAIYPYSWLKVMRNHSLIMWLWWVNDNICDKLDTDLYRTTMVKVRIATGMLNKLDSLTDSEKNEIHRYLTDNINKAVFLRIERDLPF